MSGRKDRIKVITWNLGYWQHAWKHTEAWDYLCNTIKPDIALLQEVKPPSGLNGKNIIFEEVYKGWGTAIYSPSFSLMKDHISIHPGRVALASVPLNRNTSLFIASIHAPIIKNRVFPHLDNLFKEIESRMKMCSTIIGGDLNSARLAEQVWPGNGHGPFFERIDKCDPWVDCSRKFNPVEIQTFFNKRTKRAFQDDHIFVSADLSALVASCFSLNNDFTRDVSDHIPLIAEIDL